MSDDLISRQAAIDAVDEQIKYCDKALASFDISLKDEYAVKVEKASLNAFRKTLKYLPSAQPEIIHCRDCKHKVIENDIWTCPFGLPGGPEFFCGYGDRRTKE